MIILAIRGAIPVAHGHAFPRGAWVMGPAERVRDFGESTADRPVYVRDKTTGEPVWEVPVMDGDHEVPARQRAIKVKIASTTAPVLPEPPAGLPFVPVEFVGLLVTPYVNSDGRQAFSYRAAGLQATGLADSAGVSGAKPETAGSSGPGRN